MAHNAEKDWTNIKYSKVIRAKPRGRHHRVERVKPSNKVNGIKVLSLTKESITVQAVFHYRQKDKPLKQTITFPLPDLKKIIQKIKKRKPTWSNKKCKKAAKLRLKKWVGKQLVRQWKRNKPFEETLEIENEIEVN